MAYRGGPMQRWFGRWRTGEAQEYWVDLATGAIEQGRGGPGAQRMGPYPTPEAAQHAFDTAAARNEAWDEEDRRWHEEDRRWNEDDWPEDSGPAAP